MQEYLNWKDETGGEWYEYFDFLPMEEHYTFLKYLAQDMDNPDIDYLIEICDLTYDFDMETRVEILEDLITWFPDQYQEEYAEGYSIVEQELIDYYVFKKDLIKLRQRLDYILNHTESPEEFIVSDVYFKLLYYDLIDEFEDVYKNLYFKLQKDKDEREERTEQESFLLWIFNRKMLQETYRLYKESGEWSAKKFLSFTEEFKMDLNEELFVESATAEVFQNPLNPERVLEAFKKDGGDQTTWVYLGLHFCKYMYDTYEISFLLADEIWSDLISKYSFGESQQLDEFFYIDLERMIDELDGDYDLFAMQDFADAGRVFGMDYIYDFFELYHLISAEGAQKMKENNQYFHHYMMELMGLDLWQLSFITAWPQGEKWHSLKPWFEKSLLLNYLDDLNLKEYFEEIDPLVERVWEEVGGFGAVDSDLFDDALNDYMNNYLDVEAYINETSFINEKPKVGRNDVCPCGSGKKYKKCCLK